MIYHRHHHRRYTEQSNKMISLVVLCLVASVFANPAVYVSRTTVDYPYTYYYPSWDGSLLALAPPEASEDGKEIVISAIPEAPELGRIPIKIMLEAEKPEEPKEEAIEANKEEELEEEPKDDEGKKEEAKEEEVKEEEPKAPEEGKPVVVEVEPKFLSSYIPNLPFTIPQINFPYLGSIFGKPPAAAPVVVAADPLATGPAETLRYRVAYVPV